MISDQEEAAFEAGIKLGALYHQFVGTPVSRATAGSLETAIEAAVSLQPCVVSIHVHLDRDRMDPNIHGYSELRGEMLTVEITTQVRSARCHAALSLESGYPRMRVVSFS